jgi:hypothetical protein
MPSLVCHPYTLIILSTPCEPNPDVLFRIQNFEILIIIDCDLRPVRFIIRASVPTEAGNRMMKDPNGFKQIESYIQSVKPEASYFFEAGGDRTMVFIVNMERTDQMAVIAEPLFMIGAKVEFHPVMLLEDLKKAGESLQH